MSARRSRRIRVHERQRQWELELLPDKEEEEEEVFRGLDWLRKGIVNTVSAIFKATGLQLEALAKDQTRPSPDAWSVLGARDRLLTPWSHHLAFAERVEARSMCGGGDSQPAMRITGLSTATFTPDTSLIFVFMPMSSFFSLPDTAYTLSDLTSKVFVPATEEQEESLLVSFSTGSAEEDMSGTDRKSMFMGSEEDLSGTDRKSMSMGSEEDWSGTDRKSMSMGSEKDLSGTDRKSMSMGSEKDLSGTDRKSMSMGSEKDLSGAGRKSMSMGSEKDMSGSDRKSMSMGSEKDLSETDRKSMSMGSEKDLSGSDRKSMSMTDRKSMSMGSEKTLSGTDRKSMSMGSEEDWSGTDRKSMSMGSEKDLSGSDRKSMSMGSEKDLSGSDRKSMSMGSEKDLSGTDKKSMSMGYEKDLSGSDRKSMAVGSEEDWSGTDRKSMSMRSEKDLSGRDRKSMSMGSEEDLSGTDRKSMSMRSVKDLSGSDRKSMSVGSEKDRSGSDRKSMSMGSENMSGSDRKSMSMGSAKDLSGSDRKSMSMGSEEDWSGTDKKSMSMGSEKDLSGTDRKSMSMRSEKDLSGSDRKSMSMGSEEDWSGTDRKSMSMGSEKDLSGTDRKSMSMRSEKDLSGSDRKSMSMGSEEDWSGTDRKSMSMGSEDLSGSDRKSMSMGCEKDMSGSDRKRKKAEKERVVKDETRFTELENNLGQKQAQLTERQTTLDVLEEQHRERQEELQGRQQDQEGLEIQLVAKEEDLEQQMLEQVIGKQKATKEQQKATEKHQRVTEQRLKATEVRQKATEEQQKAVEEQQKAIEEQQKATEEQRKTVVEQHKAIEEQQKVIEEQQKAVEEQQNATAEQQKAVEEQQKAVKEQQKATEVQQQIIEEQQKAVEEQQKATEVQQQIIEEQQKAVEEQQKATEVQQQIIEEQQKATEEQQKATEEQQQIIEEQQKAVEEQQKATEERQKVVEEQQKATEVQQQIIEEQQKIIDEQQTEVAEQQKAVAEQQKVTEEQQKVVEEQQKVVEVQQKAREEEQTLREQKLQEDTAVLQEKEEQQIQQQKVLDEQKQRQTEMQQQQEERQSKLDDQQTVFEETQVDLNGREKVIHETERELEEKAMEQAETERQLKEDQAILEQNQKHIRQHEELLEQKEQTLLQEIEEVKERKAKTEKEEHRLQQWDQKMQEKGDTLRQTEERLEEFQTRLTEEEEKLNERQTCLDDTEATLSERECTVKDREQQLTDKEKTLQEEHERMQTKVGELEKTEEMLAEKEQSFKELEQNLEGMKVRPEKEDELLKGRQNVLAELEEKLKEWETKNQEAGDQLRMRAQELDECEERHRVWEIKSREEKEMMAERQKALQELEEMLKDWERRSQDEEEKLKAEELKIKEEEQKLQDRERKVEEEEERQRERRKHLEEEEGRHREVERQLEQEEEKQRETERKLEEEEQKQKEKEEKRQLKEKQSHTENSWRLCPTNSRFKIRPVRERLSTVDKGVGSDTIQRQSRSKYRGTRSVPPRTRYLSPSIRSASPSSYTGSDSHSVASVLTEDDVVMMSRYKKDKSIIVETYDLKYLREEISNSSRESVSKLGIGKPGKGMKSSYERHSYVLNAEEIGRDSASARSSSTSSSTSSQKTTSDSASAPVSVDTQTQTDDPDPLFSPNNGASKAILSQQSKCSQHTNSTTVSSDLETLTVQQVSKKSVSFYEEESDHSHSRSPPLISDRQRCQYSAITYSPESQVPYSVHETTEKSESANETTVTDKTSSLNGVQASEQKEQSPIRTSTPADTCCISPNIEELATVASANLAHFEPVTEHKEDSEQGDLEPGRENSLSADQTEAIKPRKESNKCHAKVHKPKTDDECTLERTDITSTSEETSSTDERSPDFSIDCVSPEMTKLFPDLLHTTCAQGPNDIIIGVSRDSANQLPAASPGSVMKCQKTERESCYALSKTRQHQDNQYPMETNEHKTPEGSRPAGFPRSPLSPTLASEIIVDSPERSIEQALTSHGPMSASLPEAFDEARLADNDSTVQSDSSCQSPIMTRADDMEEQVEDGSVHQSPKSVVTTPSPYRETPYSPPPLRKDSLTRAADVPPSLLYRTPETLTSSHVSSYELSSKTPSVVSSPGVQTKNKTSPFISPLPSEHSSTTPSVSDSPETQIQEKKSSSVSSPSPCKVSSQTSSVIESPEIQTEDRSPSPSEPGLLQEHQKTTPDSMPRSPDLSLTCPRTYVEPSTVQSPARTPSPVAIGKLHSQDLSSSQFLQLPSHCESLSPASAKSPSNSSSHADSESEVQCQPSTKSSAKSSPAQQARPPIPTPIAQQFSPFLVTLSQTLEKMQHQNKAALQSSLSPPMRSRDVSPAVQSGSCSPSPLPHKPLPPSANSQPRHSSTPTPVSPSCMEPTSEQPKKDAQNSSPPRQQTHPKSSSPMQASPGSPKSILSSCYSMDSQSGSDYRPAFTSPDRQKPPSISPPRVSSKMDSKSPSLRREKLASSRSPSFRRSKTTTPCPSPASTESVSPACSSDGQVMSTSPYSSPTMSPKSPRVSPRVTKALRSPLAMSKLRRASPDMSPILRTSPGVSESSHSSPLMSVSTRTSPVTSKSTHPSVVTSKIPQSSTRMPRSPRLLSVMSKSPKSPSVMSKSPKSPSVMSKSSKSPSVMSKSPKSPSVMSKSPKSPSVMSKSPTSPSVMSKSPKSPSVMSKSPKPPSVMSKSPKSPSVMSKSPKSPSVMSKSPTSPSVMSKSPKSPSVMSKSPKSPSVMSKSPTSPSVMAKSPASPSVMSKSPTSPSVMSKSPTSPSVISKSPTSPSVMSKSPTSPSMMAKSPTSPSVKSKSPQSVSEIVKSPLTSESSQPSPAIPRSSQLSTLTSKMPNLSPQKSESSDVSSPALSAVDSKLMHSQGRSRSPQPSPSPKANHKQVKSKSTFRVTESPDATSLPATPPTPVLQSALSSGRSSASKLPLPVHPSSRQSSLQTVSALDGKSVKWPKAEAHSPSSLVPATVMTVERHFETHQTTVDQSSHKECLLSPDQTPRSKLQVLVAHFEQRSDDVNRQRTSTSPASPSPGSATYAGQKTTMEDGPQACDTDDSVKVSSPCVSVSPSSGTSHSSPMPGRSTVSRTHTAGHNSPAQNHCLADLLAAQRRKSLSPKPGVQGSPALSSKSTRTQLALTSGVTSMVQNVKTTSPQDGSGQLLPGVVASVVEQATTSQSSLSPTLSPMCGRPVATHLPSVTDLSSYDKKSKWDQYQGGRCTSPSRDLISAALKTNGAASLKTMLARQRKASHDRERTKLEATKVSNHTQFKEAVTSTVRADVDSGFPREHVTTSVYQKRVDRHGQPTSSIVTITQKKVTYSKEPLPFSPPTPGTAPVSANVAARPPTPVLAGRQESVQGTQLAGTPATHPSSLPTAGVARKPDNSTPSDRVDWSKRRASTFPLKDTRGKLAADRSVKPQRPRSEVSGYTPPSQDPSPLSRLGLLRIMMKADTQQTREGEPAAQRPPVVKARFPQTAAGDETQCSVPSLGISPRQLSPTLSTKSSERSVNKKLQQQSDAPSVGREGHSHISGMSPLSEPYNTQLFSTNLGLKTSKMEERETLIRRQAQAKKLYESRNNFKKQFKNTAGDSDDSDFSDFFQEYQTECHRKGISPDRSVISPILQTVPTHENSVTKYEQHTYRTNHPTATPTSPPVKRRAVDAVVEPGVRPRRYQGPHREVLSPSNTCNSSPVKRSKRYELNRFLAYPSRSPSRANPAALRNSSEMPVSVRSPVNRNVLPLSLGTAHDTPVSAGSSVNRNTLPLSLGTAHDTPVSAGSSVNRSVLPLSLGTAHDTPVSAGSSVNRSVLPLSLGTAHDTPVSAGSSVNRSVLPLSLGTAHDTPVSAGSSVNRSVLPLSVGTAHDTPVSAGSSVNRSVLPLSVGTAHDTLVSAGSSVNRSVLPLSLGTAHDTPVSAGSSVNRSVLPLSVGTAHDTLVSAGSSVNRSVLPLSLGTAHDTPVSTGSSVNRSVLPLSLDTAHDRPSVSMAFSPQLQTYRHQQGVVGDSVEMVDMSRLARSDHLQFDQQSPVMGRDNSRRKQGRRVSWNDNQSRSMADLSHNQNAMLTRDHSLTQQTYEEDTGSRDSSIQYSGHASGPMTAPTSLDILKSTYGDNVTDASPAYSGSQRKMTDMTLLKQAGTSSLQSSALPSTFPVKTSFQQKPSENNYQVTRTLTDHSRLKNKNMAYAKKETDEPFLASIQFRREQKKCTEFRPEGSTPSLAREEESRCKEFTSKSDAGSINIEHTQSLRKRYTLQNQRRRAVVTEERQQSTEYVLKTNPHAARSLKHSERFEGQGQQVKPLSYSVYSQHKTMDSVHVPVNQHKDTLSDTRTLGSGQWGQRYDRLVQHETMSATNNNNLSLCEELRNAGFSPGEIRCPTDLGQQSVDGDSVDMMDYGDVDRWVDMSVDSYQYHYTRNHLCDLNESANSSAWAEYGDTGSPEEKAFFTPHVSVDVRGAVGGVSEHEVDCLHTQQCGDQTMGTERQHPAGGHSTHTRPPESDENCNTVYFSVPCVQSGSESGDTSLPYYPPLLRRRRRRYERHHDNRNNSGDDHPKFTSQQDTARQEEHSHYENALDVPACGGGDKADAVENKAREEPCSCLDKELDHKADSRRNSTLLRRRQSLGRTYMSRLLTKQDYSESDSQDSSDNCAHVHCSLPQHRSPAHQRQCCCYTEARDSHAVDSAERTCSECGCQEREEEDLCLCSGHEDCCHHSPYDDDDDDDDEEGDVDEGLDNCCQECGCSLDFTSALILEDNSHVPQAVTQVWQSPAHSHCCEGPQRAMLAAQRESEGPFSSCQPGHVENPSAARSVPSGYCEECQCCHNHSHSYSPGRGDGDVLPAEKIKEDNYNVSRCRPQSDSSRDQHPPIHSQHHGEGEEGKSKTRLDANIRKDRKGEGEFREQAAEQHHHHHHHHDPHHHHHQHHHHHHHPEGQQSARSETSDTEHAPGVSTPKDSQLSVTESMVQAYGYNPLTQSPFSACGYPNLALDTSTLDHISLPFVKRKALVFLRTDKEEFVEVGRGTYGCVYLAQATTRRGTAKVVVKDFFTDSTSWDLIVHEARMLCYLQDTGVIPHFYGLLKRRSQGDDFSLIQQYFAQGRTLHTVLVNKEHLAPEIWQDVAWQLARGLLLIHERHVLLNDLKGDNVLIDLRRERKIIKYIDLGMATYRKGLNFHLPEDQMSKFNFLSPEVRAGAYTSPMSDVYSLGYLLDQINRLAHVQVLQEVSARCMDQLPVDRPHLAHVVDVLTSSTDMAPEGTSYTH